MDGSEDQKGGEYEFQIVAHRKRNRIGADILTDKSLKNRVIVVRR
jgi:hypothetical protein